MTPGNRLFEPSGIIDTETTDAIKTLQKKQDLKVDSYLNPHGETEQTINRLLSSVNAEEGNQTSGAEDTKPDPEEKPEKPKPEEKKKEESKCSDQQKQVEHIEAEVEKLKGEVETSESQARQALNEANDSVHRAQAELARIGLKTIIERVPGVIGFLAKLIREPGTKGTRQETEARFKALSTEHAIAFTSLSVM